MFNNERLEKRLSKSFWLVSMISAVAAIVGLIAVILVAARYSYALTNFGFAQGDIGKALFEFADVRSSLRASIGYVDEDAINNVVKQHEENKRLFEEYFAQVEKTIVSEEGRETYDEIKSELDAGREDYGNGRDFRPGAEQPGPGDCLKPAFRCLQQHLPEAGEPFGSESERRERAF